MESDNYAYLNIQKEEFEQFCSESDHGVKVLNATLSTITKITSNIS